MWVSVSEQKQYTSVILSEKVEFHSWLVLLLQHHEPLLSRWTSASPQNINLLKLKTVMQIDTVTHVWTLVKWKKVFVEPINKGIRKIICNSKPYHDWLNSLTFYDMNQSEILLQGQSAQVLNSSGILIGSFTEYILTGNSD